MGAPRGERRRQAQKLEMERRRQALEKETERAKHLEREKQQDDYTKGLGRRFNWWSGTATRGGPVAPPVNGSGVTKPRPQGRSRKARIIRHAGGEPTA